MCSHQDSMDWAAPTEAPCVRSRKLLVYSAQSQFVECRENEYVLQRVLSWLVACPHLALHASRLNILQNPIRRRQRRNIL